MIGQYVLLYAALVCQPAEACGAGFGVGAAGARAAVDGDRALGIIRRRRVVHLRKITASDETRTGRGKQARKQESERHSYGDPPHIFTASGPY